MFLRGTRATTGSAEQYLGAERGVVNPKAGVYSNLRIEEGRKEYGIG